MHEGVLCCVSEDSFYEGAYQNQIRHLPGANVVRDWVFFNLLQSGLFGEVQRALPRRSRLLDLGCASGVRWLAADYEVIGVDVSLQSLVRTVGTYAASIQARAERLPLADGCIDGAYSSYFFEHLPPDTKDVCLIELARVLRPGARSVFLFDTLSDGAFGRFARRDPEAFQRGFVAPDGHVGLELLSKAIERYELAGFEVERVLRFGTTPIQYIASYNWLDLAYGEQVPWVRTLGRFTRWLSGTRARLPLELSTTVFDRVVGPLARSDSATRAIVVARKR